LESTVEFGVLTLLIKSGLDLESTVLGKRLMEDSSKLMSELMEEFGVLMLLIKYGLVLE
jgi:hypothetical protein